MLETPKTSAPNMEKCGGYVDNQQAIGKIAGLILGEGHFSICKWQRAKGKWQFNVEIGFTNNDPALIDYICDWLDTLEIGFYMIKNGVNDCWQIKIQKFPDIMRVIAELEPHLMGRKLSEALLLKRFITKRMTHRGGNEARKYDEEDFAIVAEKVKLRESSETMSIPRAALVKEHRARTYTYPDLYVPRGIDLSRSASKI